MNQGNKNYAWAGFETYREDRKAGFEAQYNAEFYWEKIIRTINKNRSHRMIRIGITAAASLLIGWSVLHFVNSESPAGKLSSGKDPDRPFLIEQKATLFVGEGWNIKIPLNEEQKLSGNEMALARDTFTQHKITTPRGGEYRVTLSDGSQVWMAPESSLIYPVPFADEREVFFEGEGFFEVAPDDKVFRVNVGESKIEISGNSFNVRSYPQEEIYVTVPDGVLGVALGKKKVLVNKGEQAVVDEEKKTIKVKKVDASQFVSWKEGVFNFREMALADILTQVARWFDLTIQYRHPDLKEKKFTGEIPIRDLDEILSVFERELSVRFTREGQLLYVDRK